MGHVPLHSILWSVESDASVRNRPAMVSEKRNALTMLSIGKHNPPACVVVFCCCRLIRVNTDCVRGETPSNRFPALRHLEIDRGDVVLRGAGVERGREGEEERKRCLSFQIIRWFLVGTKPSSRNVLLFTLEWGGGGGATAAPPLPA